MDSSWNRLTFSLKVLFDPFSIVNSTLFNSYYTYRKKKRKGNKNLENVKCNRTWPLGCEVKPRRRYYYYYILTNMFLYYCIILYVVKVGRRLIIINRVSWAQFVIHGCSSCCVDSSCFLSTVSKYERNIEKMEGVNLPYSLRAWTRSEIKMDKRDSIFFSFLFEENRLRVESYSN